MENMDKAPTVPKWVLINRPKIPQIPQNLSAQAQKFGDFDEKRLHWASVVRVSTDQANENTALCGILEIFECRFNTLFLLLFQIFDKEGQFKFSFGVPGKDEGQLFYPRKIAVLRDSGYYVICDRGSERSRMQIFSPMGHFIRRIPIRFIDIVAGLAISREGTYLHYLRHNVQVFEGFGIKKYAKHKPNFHIQKKSSCVTIVFKTSRLICCHLAFFFTVAIR